MKSYMVDFGTLVVEAKDEDDAAEVALKMIKDDISWLDIDIVQECDEEDDEMGGGQQ